MKKKISKVINGFMVAATSVTTVGGVLATVPVQAAEPTNQTRNSGDYMVNKGVVDFGEGTSNITIKGNAGQSLVGKRLKYSSFLMLKMQKVASLSTTHLKTNMQLHLKQ